MPLGIVVALPFEAKCIAAQKFRPGHIMSVGPHKVCLSGMGRDNAHRAAVKLIQTGAGRLMSWGVAGAVKQELQPGMLLMPERVLSKTQTSYKVTEDWHHRLKWNLANQVDVEGGCLMEAEQVITTIEQKQNIYKQHGVVAVDMESAAIAEAAHDANIPFVVLRAILDSASRKVPNSILGGLGEGTELSINRILISLLTRPQDIFGLMQLGLDSYKATRTLRTVAKKVGDNFSIG